MRLLLQSKPTCSIIHNESATFCLKCLICIYAYRSYAPKKHEFVFEAELTVLEHFIILSFAFTYVFLSLQQAFLDTNPYLLGITIVVSIVHSVFEFLAFKNGECYSCGSLFRWCLFVCHLSVFQLTSVSDVKCWTWRLVI